MARNEKKRIGLAILLLGVVLIGCSQTAPKLRDGEPMSCLYFRECMYRNAKNQDKSICKDALNECLNTQRMIFCREKKNRPEKVDFGSCWDKIK